MSVYTPHQQLLLHFSIYGTLTLQDTSIPSTKTPLQLVNETLSRYAKGYTEETEGGKWIWKQSLGSLTYEAWSMTQQIGRASCRERV